VGLEHYTHVPLNHHLKILLISLHPFAAVTYW
jgi:hypothetical protein